MLLLGLCQEVAWSLGPYFLLFFIFILDPTMALGVASQLRVEKFHFSGHGGIPLQSKEFIIFSRLIVLQSFESHLELSL